MTLNWFYISALRAYFVVGCFVVIPTRWPSRASHILSFRVSCDAVRCVDAEHCAKFFAFRFAKRVSILSACIKTCNE